MKFKILFLIIAILLCTTIESSAGCSGAGRCLIQLNSQKKFIEFINNNPYRIQKVDYKWFIIPVYYVWYVKEASND